MTKQVNIKKLCFSALCLALTLFLPFLTGQIPQIGSALSPMHIPILICGFLCGAPYAFVIGLIAPALRFFLFGMPPLFPVGAAMTFELAAYGFFSGYLYKKLPNTTPNIYISLIAAMLLGRIVWGAAMTFIAGISDVTFSLQMFLASGFLNAIPGIICHILLIPVIVIALKKAHILEH